MPTSAVPLLLPNFVCYTASVSGAGAVGIDFNPNYSPAVLPPD